MTEKTIEQQKEKLLALRQSLLADIAALKETLRGEVDVDVDEGDPDIVEREKSGALLESLETQLASVEDALRAMEKGTYGICERCGEAIAPARLEVKPEATLCIKCQGELDRLRRRGMMPTKHWNDRDYTFG